MTIPTLAELTTFRVGGPIGDYLATDDRAALIDAIKKADEAERPLLVIGGGSNLLACDEGFDGLVVKDLRSEIHIEQTPASTRVQEEREPAGSCPATCRVTASAGTIWDELVSRTVDEGLSGLEALSGIPGTVGAAPVQNIGAYGHELGETLLKVRAWDRHKKQEVTLSAEELAFGYRESIIKRSIHTGDESGRLWGPSGRWIVLEATFLLEVSPLSSPVLYRELAQRLGIEQGGRSEARIVRDTVLALRRTKGMVLDPEDHDSWSAGSFFTNPILDQEAADRLPAEAPRFTTADGRVKTSAAWLIDHAGFPRGYSIPGAHEDGAALSGKHVLALTNRGQASAAEIVELAFKVREGVEERFGVHLVPEPLALGISW